MTLGTHRRLAGLLALAALLVAPLVAPTGATALAGAPSTIVMAWGTESSVVRGTRVTVTGSFAPPNLEDRKVQLQRDVPGGWKTLSTKGVPGGTASFSFTLPTSYYGSFTFRVVSPASATEDAAESATTQTLEVRPSYTPRGKASSHTFLIDAPVRWNPCARIDYRVNDARARSGALADVKKAILRIRYATGLNFHYAGKTSKVPAGGTGDRYPAGTELVIAWARPAASNMLGAGATAAGRGGPVWTSGYEDGAGKATYLIKQGGVVLNANLNAHIRAGFGKGQTRGELVMHEVGHALGLGHTDARGQIMFPKLQDGIARFEAGDLAGLNRLGAEDGCLVRASARAAPRSAPTRMWSSAS